MKRIEKMSVNLISALHSIFQSKLNVAYELHMAINRMIDGHFNSLESIAVSSVWLLYDSLFLSISICCWCKFAKNNWKKKIAFQ